MNAQYAQNKSQTNVSCSVIIDFAQIVCSNGLKIQINVHTAGETFNNIGMMENVIKLNKNNLSMKGNKLKTQTGLVTIAMRHSREILY